jgi:predicted GTPase
MRSKEQLSQTDKSTK